MRGQVPADYVQITPHTPCPKHGLKLTLAKANGDKHTVLENLLGAESEPQSVK